MCLKGGVYRLLHLVNKINSFYFHKLEINRTFVKNKFKTMSNTIQRIIEIDLDEVQSPNYDANLRKYGEDSNSCLICGKRIKNIEKAKYVHLLENGNLVSYGGHDIVGSQGLFPVGTDCAKKLVITFTF